MGCILTEWVKNSLLGILLVRFVHILLFRHFLCSFVHRMQKIEKLSKIVVNFLDDFLPILYHKVKNYCFLPKRHPLATIVAMQIDVFAMKIFFWHYSMIQITVSGKGTETSQVKSPYQICNQSVSLQYTKNCINLPVIINASNRRDKISRTIDSEVKYEK